jgi:hypothetical protein
LTSIAQISLALPIAGILIGSRAGVTSAIHVIVALLCEIVRLVGSYHEFLVLSAISFLGFHLLSHVSLFLQPHLLHLHPVSFLFLLSHSFSLHSCIILLFFFSSAIILFILASSSLFLLILVLKPSAFCFFSLPHLIFISDSFVHESGCLFLSFPFSLFGFFFFSLPLSDLLFCFTPALLLSCFSFPLYLLFSLSFLFLKLLL